MNRYIKQTTLPEIGPEGQLLIQKSRVLCVGLGGLGSPASLYLAAAGVGTLGLLDSDQVDATNLQRQTLFSEATLGQDKVTAALHRLQALNSMVNYRTHQERLTANTIESIFKNYDLILDCTDNFETKFLINDAAVKLGLPVVFAAINAFEGQVALFYSKQGPCYRCLYPEPPRASIQNCDEAGILGSVAGTLGTLQATLALQWIISHQTKQHPLTPRIGQMTLLDFAGAWTMHNYTVQKNRTCSVCGRAPEEIVLQKTTATAQVIGPEALRALIQNQEPHLLLDVREKDEWDKSHLKSALHWPLSQLLHGEFPQFDPHPKHIVVFCKTGTRSSVATKLLASTPSNEEKTFSCLTGPFPTNYL